MMSVSISVLLLKHYVETSYHLTNLSDMEDFTFTPKRAYSTESMLTFVRIRLLAPWISGLASKHVENAVTVRTALSHTPTFDDDT